MDMPRGSGARSRRSSRRLADETQPEGVSKALVLDPVVASATLTDDALDGIIDGIAASFGLADAIEYAGTDGGFDVVGFQIAPTGLDDRLAEAVAALTRGSDDAAPLVRMRLEELALRSFADAELAPPLDGGPAGSGLEWDAVLAPEGRLTDDGRAFAPGSIRWRELPLTLMAMLETWEGHDGARVCGRIDRIWRDEEAGLIRAAGVFDDSDFGREIARLVDERVLRGNSVDLAIHDYDAGPRSRWFDDDGNWAPTEAADDSDDLAGILFDEQEEPTIYVVTDAVIGMSTVCPFPAFADGAIEVARSVAAAGSPAVWTFTHDAAFRLSPERPRDVALVASAYAKTGVVSASERERLADRGYSISPGEVLAAWETPAPVADALLDTPNFVQVGEAGGGASLFGFSASAREFEFPPGFPYGGSRGLTAAVAPPTAPPAAWFEQPDLEYLTPLIVTDDGRIWGHAAGWSSCHTGFPGVCVTPPRSETDYRFFLLKEIECDDGSVVACGTITLEAPHANQSLGLVDATAHYDNTGMAAADVVVGEDEHGIWIAGAIRPHMTEEMIRELRGASLSGDWRNYEGNLEMIGLLAVNVPGFPIPRVHARTAGGVLQSLVAAGVVDLDQVEAADEEALAEAGEMSALERAQLVALTNDELAGLTEA